MRAQGGTAGSAVGDWLCKSNPGATGRRMRGSKCEQCVAMHALQGSQEKQRLKGAHVINDLTVVDSRLHTQ